MSTAVSESSATVARILRAATDAAARLEEGERALFIEFCRAVGRQLRTSYTGRHGVQGVVEQLLPHFRSFQRRGMGQILVELQAGPVTTVRTCMADQPFILDTVRLLLSSHRAHYEGGFNAVVPVRRDAEGKVLAVGVAGDPLESIIGIEFSPAEGEDIAALEQSLSANLRLASAMVSDFSAMTGLVERLAGTFRRAAARTPSQADVLQETADFLTWLLSDNFVFMGARVGEERLGFERAGHGEPGAAEFEGGAWPELPVQVRKGTVESPVHRSGRMDELLVRSMDESGNPGPEVLLRGMFTFRAVTQPSRNVPILRRILGRILQQEESRPGSWRYKGVANVFDSLPTEFLFTASVDEVSRMIDRVLEAEVEQQVGVHLIQKPRSNMIFSLAAMPRAQYSERVRRRLDATLRAETGATYVDHGVFFGRYETALAYFYLTGARALSPAELERLQGRLAAMATPWDDGLYNALLAHHGEDEADRLFARWGAAFSEDYTLHNDGERAATDIAALERLSPTRPVLADLYEDRKGRLNLRIYQGGDLLLSHLMPVLDNFGLIISDQYNDPVSPVGGPARDIDTFRIRGVEGLSQAQIVERAPKLLAGIEAALDGRLVDDSLNHLLLRANLSWREVDLIRAYRGYTRQIGHMLTLARVQEILVNQAHIVRGLVDYFIARFDPDLPAGERDARMATAAEGVEADLRRIRNHDEDTLMRAFYGLFRATLRTNFFRTDRLTHYISFKISHALAPNLPEPRMKFEIYVHHPEVEALHLRGGKIARGGIRWSDRSDFRTEVLDLVRTQMVKNVLIVPEGAKGGFFLKKLIRDPKLRRQKADELYRFLVRGMLDVTDNLVDGQIVRPPRVVAHDEDDPYLVVAADKGTAHLSDTANRVAVEEYGFWLGDAFASGGSCGYDHKVVGITARGGWVLVRRHFRELGLDPVHQDFTAVGIGDTGGDVFGNGVIEHSHMKLLAAFNHMHVFLDPDPDPERTFAERKRLFDAVRGWDAYDRSLISEGGGIYERSDKSIPLSPQARKMLGTLAEELPPDAVIRLILRMPVDLLWNGGIGTYVKASHESHQDAGDTTNDQLRVNANELRCRVVGEGGNLGFTQAGRIEYALLGGRINTDAVDNSGGVDMSDHEVNLKILLTRVMAAGKLDRPARDVFIEQLTDEVAQAVLDNSDAHGRQLSFDHARSVNDPVAYSRAIAWVCQHSGTSREFLRLPSDEVLRQRAVSRKGLTRPELATIAAHVKMHVYKMLLEGDTAAVPGFAQRLVAYFPKAVGERFPDEVQGHMLAKAIGMTTLLTDVVADCGAMFFPLLMDLSGRDPATIAGAWVRLYGAFDLPGLYRDLFAEIPQADTAYLAWVRAVDNLVGLLAVSLAPGEQLPSEAQVARMKALLPQLAGLRGRQKTERYEERVARLTGKGVPRALAVRVTDLGELGFAREILLAQERSGDSDRDAVVRFLAVGQASGVLPVLRALEGRATEGPWDPVALGILRSRFLGLLRRLLEVTPLGQELALGTDELERKLRTERLSAISRILDEILSAKADVGALLVAEERLRATVLQ